MSEREPENQHEKEPKERASDREIVDFIIKHIDSPCEVNIGEEVHNIREFYIREAERFLDEGNKQKIKDPKQIERLKEKIQKYKPL